MPLSLTIEKVCPVTGARATTIRTARGELHTPLFMPVGTYGAVKALATPELAAMGFRMLLGNALHLYMRPGLDVIRNLGGLHRFMGWAGHLLTDSGGYQLFSLREFIKVSDDGVTFQSPIDGAKHFLTPALVMEIQQTLGSDFIMPLDHCPPSTEPLPVLRAALERTTAWLAEQVALFEAAADPNQSLFGIVQGGVDLELRRESLAQITGLPIDALAIGGLAVGESQAQMFGVLEALQNELPESLPHYLMGVGYPDDLVGAIGRGMDLFDCALPTRVARNATAITSQGKMNLRGAKYREDPAPLDPACDCQTCRTTSRALISHLVKIKHISASTLISQHNMATYARLTREARAAILGGTFPAWSERFLSQWEGDHEEPVEWSRSDGREDKGVGWDQAGQP